MAAPHTTPSAHDLELLSAYLDGELSDRARASLEQRLRDDIELRVVLDDLRETVDMVRGLPRLKAPRHFTLDPAIYSRPAPWWQQLFTLGSILQLSGALGAVAAIMLIAGALLLGGGADRDETTAPEAALDKTAETGAAAMLPTATWTLLPSTVLAAEQATAIANANTDAVAFDATLAAQSMMYASTEVAATWTAETVYHLDAATEMRLTPTFRRTYMPPPTLEVAGAQANAAGEALEDTGAEETTAEAGEEGFAAAPEAASAPSEAESYEATGDDAVGAAPPQPQPTIPLPQSEGPAMLEVQPPSGNGGDIDADTSFAVTEAPELGMADNAPGTTDGNAQREPFPSPSPTRTRTPTRTPTRTATQLPLPSPTVPASATPEPLVSAPETDEGLFAATPAAVGQAALDESEPPADGVSITQGREEKSAPREESADLTWLAGLGAAILLASLVLFVVGRRRAHRA